MSTTLGLLLFISVLVGLASASWSDSSSLFPDKYDRLIERSVKTWWLEYPDWLTWKAQLYQESRLDPSARSPVGAAGLAQFMPATWADMVRQMQLGGASPHDVGPAITAGAYYMAQLRRTWKAKRSIEARHVLAQASYNAGTGNILKAQALCGGARFWAEIAPCLGKVTGPQNARETRTYVERIARWRGMMGSPTLVTVSEFSFMTYWHDHRLR